MHALISSCFAVLLFLFSGPVLFAQQSTDQVTENVRSGPMLGYSEMREVMLWVQTTGPAEVYFTYSEQGLQDPYVHSTNKVMTDKAHAFTAHCLADAVWPGKRYDATLYVNGKAEKLPYPVVFQTQALWQWRTDAPDFRAALGSCNFVNEPELDRPGDGYGGDYQIFDHIVAQKPDMMLWLGDNVYLREADWNTRTGIHHRYTHDRGLAQIQPLLAQAHHYAIWDDHDYGPNNSSRAYVHKETTLEAFKLFWANPSYGLPDTKGGITSQFSWSDCDFFLLDNRYFRSANDRKTGEKKVLGQEQIDWLIDALVESHAPFKFVCVGGMMLSTTDKYENHIHLAPEERQQIMDAIQAENIRGVIFLTGDRHHTEMTLWHPEGGVPVYDFTVSPLTATAYGGDEGQNSLLVAGSEVGERNFAIMDVTGPRRDRKLAFKVYNAQGEEKWSYEIREKDMWKR